MSATSGPIFETPLAFYDHDSLCWRMSQDTFPWEPPPSLEILPPSGMTHNGRLYERPTSEPHTSENDFSLLPTPTVEQGRSFTSGMATGDGRKPGSTGKLGLTLNDLAFLQNLKDTGKPSPGGKKPPADVRLFPSRAVG